MTKKPKTKLPKYVMSRAMKCVCFCSRKLLKYFIKIFRLYPKASWSSCLTRVTAWERLVLPRNWWISLTNTDKQVFLSTYPARFEYDIWDPIFVNSVLLFEIGINHFLNLKVFTSKFSFLQICKVIVSQIIICKVIQRVF